MSIEKQSIGGSFKVDPGTISYDTGSLSSGFSGGSTGGGFMSAMGGWAGVAQSAAGAIAGYAQNKVDQKESARKYAQTKEELAIAAKNDREVKAAQMASDYFYNRMNRDRRRQGVNSIRQFKSDGAVDVYKNPGV